MRKKNQKNRDYVVTVDGVVKFTISEAMREVGTTYFSFYKRWQRAKHEDYSVVINGRKIEIKLKNKE